MLEFERFLEVLDTCFLCWVPDVAKASWQYSALVACAEKILPSYIALNYTGGARTVIRGQLAMRYQGERLLCHFIGRQHQYFCYPLTYGLGDLIGGKPILAT
jgi:hypothetical protein